MATVTIRATDQCAGGEHVTIEAVLDGTVTRTAVLSVTQMRDALANEDVDPIALYLIRLFARGRTLNQFRNGMIAGFTVTIG